MSPERYKQIDALAEAASALSGDAREDFLRRACGSDQELLRGVSDLVRGFEASDGFLEKPALQGWAADLAATPEPGSLIGREVGRYLILSHLGSGGIGDVWLARDHKLTRQVALKLLSPELAGDAAHIRRFQQEAKAASRLNHPNLVTIFDIGEFEGRQFIAQEYVEGRTLRNILAGGPMTVEAAVDAAAQVAAALDTAHTAGIIHRDIKPENIMLRADGLVKVVDFGLARFLEAAAPSIATQQESALTRPGFVIGTVRYMSPEQARGGDVDGRGDIFSLGAVLYEMLTGKSPFAADTSPDVMAAILARDPAPLSEVSPQVTPALAAIVHRCLEKDPEKRYQAAAALRGDLLRIQPPTAAAVRGTRPPRWLPITAAALLLTLLAVVLLWGAGRVTAVPDRHVLRYSLLLPPGQMLDSLAISPSGDQVVYSAFEGGNRRIYRRFLEEEIARPVTGSEGGEEPFFSPDGRQIAFYAPHSLRLVDGASWRDLVAIPAEFYLRRAFWGADGNIYYSSPLPGEGAVEAIWRVAAAGGKPQLVLRSALADKGATIYFAQQLSGSKWLLCSSITGPLRRSLERLDLTRLNSPDNPPVRIVEHGMGGQLLPAGRLLYLWGGRLLAARFDDRAAVLSGSPMEVLPDVDTNRWFGPKAAVSGNGTLAYSRYVMPQRQLSWISPDGRQTPLDLPLAAYLDAEVSPDGTRLVVSRQDAQDRWTLWLVDLRTRAWTQIGETNVPLPKGLWSPAGNSIVASLAKDGSDFVNLYRIPVNDPQHPERLTTEPDFGQYPLSWSSANRSLLYVEGTRPGTQSDIFALSLDNRKTRSLVAGPSPDGSPSFSRDGLWFVWASRHQTGSEIFIQPFDQGTPPRKLADGQDPLWSPDGKSLYYLDGDSSLVQMPIRDGAAGTGKVIAGRLSGLQTGWWARAYSASPDGRLLVIRNVNQDAPAPQQIHIVVNWLEEVKRAVP